MKITICDPCKTFDGEIVETQRYMRVKGMPNLRLDICPKHSLEVKALNMVDYVRYAYKCNGVELKQTDQEIKEQFLRR